MSKIYLIFENEEWLNPLIEALEAHKTPFEKWSMIGGNIDLMKDPPQGVFFNRMSASAHTRGHRFSPEYTACVINWLENYGRRVINGGSTIQLEINKAAQYNALVKANIRVPNTQVILGKDDFIKAAKQTKTPFIIKHNRAGKGLSVKLIHDLPSIEGYLQSNDYEPPVDGIWLIQEYIESPEPFITRIEFINGKFVYAVKVNTEQGFELCPADACEITDAYCPIDSETTDKFEIIQDFQHPLVTQYESFMAKHNLDISAFEFISDKNNNAFTYDINTNTNYNSQAEEKIGIFAYQQLAQFLSSELNALNI